MRRKAWVYILLALSVLGNMFLGWQWRQRETNTRLALVDLTRSTVYPLNTAVASLLKPDAPWDNPTFRRDLYTLLDQASRSGTVAGELGGSVTGEPAQVAGQLHQIASGLDEYRLLTSRLQSGPVNPEDKTKLQAWAQKLHDQGWPLNWVLQGDFGPDQGWSQLRTTFDQTLSLMRQ
jgi:hypothetical protein